MAERTGLEPVASGVTGRRYNQLNYHPLVVTHFSKTGSGSSLVGGTGLEPVASCV